MKRPHGLPDARVVTLRGGPAGGVKVANVPWGVTAVNVPTTVDEDGVLLPLTIDEDGLPTQSFRALRYVFDSETNEWRYQPDSA